MICSEAHLKKHADWWALLSSILLLALLTFPLMSEILRILKFMSLFKKLHHLWHCVVVQLLNHLWPFVTPWTTAGQSPLSSTISQSLFKFISTESVMPSNHLVLCHLRLLLPSIFPSIRVFSSELSLHIRRPKYWSFGFAITPSNEYSWLISFRIDWFDLLAIQRTLKSVHRKGNQSWIFIGRTDAEAETPILWPPGAKNWLTGKEPDAGKD